MLTYLILAISTSIDSAGIGITYGLRNTTIQFNAKIIVFLITVFISGIALLIGNILSSFIPENLTTFIGSAIVICMGITIIFQARKKNKEDLPSDIITENKADICIENKHQKVYKFFIKFLGITIQIIRDPKSSDLDDSNKIDSKEAIYLGTALSIDSFSVGIGTGVMQYGSFMFPVLVGLTQIIFLSLGRFVGVKIKNISRIRDNIWSIISGILLMLIGIIRIFY